MNSIPSQFDHYRSNYNGVDLDQLREIAFKFHVVWQPRMYKIWKFLLVREEGTKLRLNFQNDFSFQLKKPNWFHLWIEWLVKGIQTIGA